MDLAAVLEHIERNLTGDLSLSTLAQRAGLSPHHFLRVFHARVGEPPRQYVRRLRLERAATHLKLTGRRVTDVAFAVGYDTHEGFTRAFGAHFGTSPQRFRAALPAVGMPAGLVPRIETLPARLVACLRYVGPYDRTAAAFDRLVAWMEKRSRRHDTALAFYWDDQDITAAGRTRCELAMVADDAVEGEAEIRMRIVGGGDHAVIDHRGSVAERCRVYDAAFRTWLPSIGRRPANLPPFEAYAVTDRGVDQVAARIHIPLRPR